GTGESGRPAARRQGGTPPAGGGRARVRGTTAGGDGTDGGAAGRAPGAASGAGGVRREGSIYAFSASRRRIIRPDWCSSSGATPAGRSSPGGTVQRCSAPSRSAYAP